MVAGRKPSVRYWPSRKAYCVTVNKQQHTLARGPDDAPDGPTYFDALTAFKKLMGLDAGKGTGAYTVAACLNQYRLHLNRTREGTSPGIFDSLSHGFCDTFGKLPVGSLRAGDVQAWLDAQSQWNPTSKNFAGQLLLGAIRWAYRKGYIPADPLTGRIDLPTPIKRGREARMSKDLCDTLVAAAFASRGGKQNFGEFLTVLRETGCRPIELRRAEAWNVEAGKIRYRWNATAGYVHKTARKTQRDRVVFLNARCEELVEGLCRRHPTGPIFRTPRGKPWSASSLQSKWVWLCVRPKVLEVCSREGVRTVEKWHENAKHQVADLRMYNFRHTFISDYLDATQDIWTAARLCGTSVQMIESRYGHPDEDKVHAKLRAFYASP